VAERTPPRPEGARAYAVRDELGVFACTRGTRAVAASLGFDPAACDELAIVASELATNALRHGKGGVFDVGPVHDPALGLGVRLAAKDRGPPIRDLAKAMIDGSDDQGPLDPARVFGRRGIGAGLGAVVRFTHRFGVEQGDGEKVVWAERFLARGSARTRAATPYRGR